jgi:hypothetical protein
MALELSGKLIKKLEVQSGTGDRGQWSRQSIVIEVPGQYTRTVCLSLWNEQVNEAAHYNIGDLLKVSFDLQSREFNGKWYTDVRPWRMEREAISVATVAPAGSVAPAATAASASSAAAGAATVTAPASTQGADDLPAPQEDDLPF